MRTYARYGLVILMLVVTLTACGLANNSNSEDSSSSSSKSNQSQSDQNQSGESSSSLEAENGAKYVDYSPAALADAQANGRAVIFFYAVWCPTCNALNNELNSGGLGNLPSDVTILKADYDNENDLKQKYGIGVQHSLVQVDDNGNEVTKWTGGGVEVINENLQ